ncbi:MAG TPA: hypothetical protein VL443_29865 [Cyclobacteriaceae bacterium]|nr:hypothetical protein [Cyclobacteriaceae bacterium]
MKNNNYPAIPDKQPGKCPILVRVNKSKESKEWTVAIPGNGSTKPTPEEYIQILKDLTATKDSELAQDICLRGICAMPEQNENEQNINIVYQILSDMEPKDSVEARLALQIHTLYAQGMEYLNRAKGETKLHHSEFYMKCALKILRLHNESLEALSRYRRKGEQRVVVQHVNVENGGKAIVGNILTEGGSN